MPVALSFCRDRRYLLWSLSNQLRSLTFCCFLSQSWPEIFSTFRRPQITELALNAHRYDDSVFLFENCKKELLVVVVVVLFCFENLSPLFFRYSEPSCDWLACVNHAVASPPTLTLWSKFVWIKRCARRWPSTQSCSESQSTNWTVDLTVTPCSL